MNTLKQNQQNLDLEAVLALFDLPDYDVLHDACVDNIEHSALYAYAYKHDYEYDASHYSMTQEDDDGEYTIDLDIDSIRFSDEFEKYVDQAESPYYRAWQRAVETVLDRYLEYHQLSARRVKILYVSPDDGKRFKIDGYQIRPLTTWKKACESLVETINGVGYFWFDSVLEFKNHIPAISYKQSVLSHLHSITEWGEVYDGMSPQRLYESELEDNLRYV